VGKWMARKRVGLASHISTRSDGHQERSQGSFTPAESINAEIARLEKARALLNGHVSTPGRARIAAAQKGEMGEVKREVGAYLLNGGSRPKYLVVDEIPPANTHLGQGNAWCMASHTTGGAPLCSSSGWSLEYFMKTRITCSVLTSSGMQMVWSLL
jgi:hypothetical protein